MEPISNADRLVLLLRQKLEERAKAERGRRSNVAVSDPSTSPTVSSVRALAATENKDEGPLRRAIIQHILADQLGPELLNDANFQEIVGRVTETIEDDAEIRALLNGVAAELRETF